MRIKLTRSTQMPRLAAMTLLAFCLFQLPVRAQEMTQHILMSPSFGFVPSQRISFTLFVPDRTPVLAQVTLFDAGGHRVAESAEVRIAANEFYSFNFNASDIRQPGEEGTGRHQLRASCWVRVAGPWERIGEFGATLEIVEVSTGITDGLSNTFLVSERLPHGEIARIDSMVGISPGQSLRFSALPTPDSSRSPEPISVLAKVYDEGGNVIGVSRELEILPGQFGWVSFSYNDLGIEGEPYTGRKQVRITPFIDFRSNELSSVSTSLEILNNDTGQTSAYSWAFLVRRPTSQ